MPAESAPMAFDATDRLEGFQNDFGSLAFSRTPVAPGTGVQFVAAANQHHRQLHRRVQRLRRR
jgi:hypothetical protein